MESGVYYKSCRLPDTLVQIIGRRVFTVLSVLAVTALAGCELSPEQVKFRDPPKGIEQSRAICNGTGCPESTESSGNASPASGH